MSTAATIRLTFASNIQETARSRIAYAFRVFCAVYGYKAQFAGEDGGSTVACVHYGAAESDHRSCHTLPSTYVPRSDETPAPKPSTIVLPNRPAYSRLNIAAFPAFCGHDGLGVDWLGEIFEWISSADEYAVTSRDSVGRVPYAATVHGRYGLDPSLPYAAIAMFEFNAALRARAPALPERPASPLNDAAAIIAATHDLDFLPRTPFDSAVRLAKNILKATVAANDRGLAREIAFASMRGIFRGRSPLNYVKELRTREQAMSIDSTFNVLCYRAHSRDANYSLRDSSVRKTLRSLRDSRAEIAVHGSYTSLESPNGLENEFALLRGEGFSAHGIRQHWLRHSGSKLYDALEAIGVKYDTTLGYSERAGFRSGASFPYPPYCFREERAYRFLEIPLAIMDGSLYEQDRSGQSLMEVCNRILEATRTFGWGGVSVLWHNTAFEGGQLPRAIGDIYWKLPREGDLWTTAENVADAVRDRYAQAGLTYA